MGGQDPPPEINREGLAEGAAFRVQSEVRGVVFWWVCFSCVFLVWEVPRHDGRILPRQGNVRWGQEWGKKRRREKTAAGQITSISRTHTLIGGG